MGTESPSSSPQGVDAVQLKEKLRNLDPRKANSELERLASCGELKTKRILVQSASGEEVKTIRSATVYSIPDGEDVAISYFLEEFPYYKVVPIEVERQRTVEQMIEDGDLYELTMSLDKVSWYHIKDNHEKSKYTGGDEFDYPELHLGNGEYWFLNENIGISRVDNDSIHSYRWVGIGGKKIFFVRDKQSGKVKAYYEVEKITSGERAGFPEVDSEHFCTGIPGSEVPSADLEKYCKLIAAKIKYMECAIGKEESCRTTRSMVDSLKDLIGE